MRRDIDRDDQSSVDGDNDQGKEHAQIDRRNYKKIERGNTLGVIAEKGLPTLRRRPASFGHVLGHRGLPHFKAKLQKFAVNPWCTPQRIVEAHLTDQLADRLGTNERDAASDTRKQLIDQDKEESIQTTQSKTLGQA